MLFFFLSCAHCIIIAAAPIGQNGSSDMPFFIGVDHDVVGMSRSKEFMSVVPPTQHHTLVLVDRILANAWLYTLRLFMFGLLFAG